LEESHYSNQLSIIILVLLIFPSSQEFLFLIYIFVLLRFWEEKTAYTPESRLAVHEHMKKTREREERTAKITTLSVFFNLDLKFLSSGRSLPSHLGLFSVHKAILSM
jgi:hypothetical protein